MDRTTIYRIAWVAALALVAAGCGSSPDSTDTAAESPETTTTTVPADTTTTSRAVTTTTQVTTTTEAARREATELTVVLEVGRDPGSLPPDLYVDRAFTAAGQLDLIEPLDVRFYDDGVVIVRDQVWDDEANGQVSFMVPLGVMPADQAGIHQPHEPALPEAAVPVPTDLGGWLETIEQVRITGTGSLETEAGTATWYDFVVPDDTQTFNCGFHPTCIGLIAMTDGVWVYLTGVHHRLYQIDTLPGLVVVAHAAPDYSPTVFADADALITGLTIKD